MWFFVKEIALPLSDTKNIQLELKLQKQKSEQIKTSIAFEKRVELLKAEFDKKAAKHISDLEVQKREKQKIKTEHENLLQAYNSLFKKASLTGEKQELFQKKVKQAEETIKQQEIRIKTLDKKIQDEKRTEDIAIKSLDPAYFESEEFRRSVERGIESAFGG